MPDEPAHSRAPWTPAEVASLNDCQAAGVMHPFTCGTDSRHEVLRATAAGWECPCCDYRQDWAHEFMVNGAWRQLLPDYDPGPSFADLVNRPLSRASIEALRKALASKDPAAYRKVRMHRGGDPESEEGAAC